MPLRERRNESCSRSDTKRKNNRSFRLREKKSLRRKRSLSRKFNRRKRQRNNLNSRKLAKKSS